MWGSINLQLYVYLLLLHNLIYAWCFSFSLYRYIKLLTGVLEWQETQSEWFAMHNNNNYCHYSRNFAASECNGQKFGVHATTYTKSVIKPVKCNSNEGNNISSSRRVNGRHKSQVLVMNGDTSTMNGGSSSHSSCNGYDKNAEGTNKSTKSSTHSPARSEKSENVKKKKP